MSETTVLTMKKSVEDYNEVYKLLKIFTGKFRCYLIKLLKSYCSILKKEENEKKRRETQEGATASFSVEISSTLFKIIKSVYNIEENISFENVLTLIEKSTINNKIFSDMYFEIFKKYGMVFINLSEEKLKLAALESAKSFIHLSVLHSSSTKTLVLPLELLQALRQGNRPITNVRNMKLEDMYSKIKPKIMKTEKIKNDSTVEDIFSKSKDTNVDNQTYLKDIIFKLEPNTDSDLDISDDDDDENLEKQQKEHKNTTINDIEITDVDNMRINQKSGSNVNATIETTKMRAVKNITIDQDDATSADNNPENLGRRQKKKTATIVGSELTDAKTIHIKQKGGGNTNASVKRSKIANAENFIIDQ